MSPSTAQGVVHARIGLERRRISRLDGMRKVGPAADLIQRLAGDRINSLLSDLEHDCSELERKAARRVDRDAFVKLADLQRGVDRAAAETLELALGALAREAGLGTAAVEEAEVVVSWLANQVDGRLSRPVVPGTAHALHGATDVIHRLVPDHGVWDLPLMAHELGHVVVSGLRSWDAQDDQMLRPVESYLSTFGGWDRSRANELFCDVFATYTLGPSYLCTLVFNKLSWVTTVPDTAPGTHPSDRDRVYACQWALKRMRGQAAIHLFDTQLLRAAEAWDQMRFDDSHVEDGHARAQLNQQLAGCWAVLLKSLSALRYRPTAVLDLAAALSEPESSATRPSADLVGDCSPADVLNAAWIVRLNVASEQRSFPVDLEERVRTLLQLCRKDNR